MLLVQIVGIVLVVVGIILLFVSLSGQSTVTLPGFNITAPPALVVLLLGVAVFLFPFSPWWPETSPSQSAAPVDGGQPTQVMVPDLTGLDGRAADNLLMQNGLNPNFAGEEPGGPSGQIVRQEPPQGTFVAPGEVVSYWISP